MTTMRPDSPAQPLIDLERLVAGIRWRRRMWTAFALLGVLAGVSLAVLIPPQPTAVTTLLVVHENDSPSDAGTLIATDVTLVQTSTIATAAAERRGNGETAESFEGTYEVVGLTNNLMELTVTGASNTDAVARAQALADAFIADHIQRTEDAAEAEAAALLSRRDKAEAQLAKVDAAIADATRGEDASVAGLDTLYSRRAELTTQIQQLGQQAEEVGGGVPRVTAGTRIVDAPHAERISLLRAGVLNGGIGLALGLALGLGLAAVASVVADRPVLRRDIAEHLGASVIAQLRAPARGPARLWRRPGMRKRVAAGLARVIRQHQGTVSLLELGTPRTTAALAVDIAAKLVPDPVVLIDDLPGRQLQKATRLDGPIRVTDAADAPLTGSPGAHQIGVGSVEPGTAWPDLSSLGAETVLVVRAGHADSRWLHTVARQLAAARIPVIGVVLVHPDPRDRSDGTLWNGLQTALRGRVAPVSPNGDLTQRAPVEVP